MSTRTQANTDSAQALSGPKTLTSPIINNGTAGADPVVALGLATKQYVDGLAASIPSGAILPYGGASAPSTAWLICDGAAVSRSTYAALFAILGTAFGVGDGATTFNLPDLRGRVPLGIDGAAGRITAASTGGANADTRGGAGGGETHALITAEMPAHTHPINIDYDDSDGTGTSKTLFGDNIVGDIGTVAETTSSTGGDGAHSNTQPWQAVNYIVKT